MIRKTLEATDEDVSYTFVEYDGDFCVLTVETDTRYAIVHCPVDQIDHERDYSFEVDWLLDDLIRESYLDYALETRNKELFDAVLAYRSTPKPERAEEPAPKPQLYYEGVYDMTDGEFLFGDDLDFGTDEYWKYNGGE